MIQLCWDTARYRLLAGLGLERARSLAMLPAPPRPVLSKCGVRVLVVLDGRLVQVADVRLTAAPGRMSIRR